MWGASKAMKRWHAAMAAQDAHEVVCAACRQHRTPACSEGRMLQNIALMMHQGWVIDRYASEAA